jgi:hypothetical protein
LHESNDGWVCDDCDVETKAPEPIEEIDGEEIDPEPLDKEPVAPDRKNEARPEPEDPPIVPASLVDQVGSTLDFEDFREFEVAYANPKGQQQMRFGYQKKTVRRKIKKINWADTVQTLRRFYPRWAEVDTPENPNPDRRAYTRLFNLLYWRSQVGMSFPEIVEHQQRVFGIKSTIGQITKLIERFEEAASWVSDIRKDGEAYYSAREVSDALDIPQSELISRKKHGRDESISSDIGAGFMFTLKQFQVLAAKLERHPVTKKPDDPSSKWKGVVHLPCVGRYSIRSAGIYPTEFYLNSRRCVPIR